MSHIAIHALGIGIASLGIWLMPATSSKLMAKYILIEMPLRSTATFISGRGLLHHRSIRVLMQVAMTTSETCV